MELPIGCCVSSLGREHKQERISCKLSRRVVFAFYYSAVFLSVSDCKSKHDHNLELHQLLKKQMTESASTSSPSLPASLLPDNDVAATRFNGRRPIAMQSSKELFSFSDCGMDADRPIKIVNLLLNPVPLRITPAGGRVKFSATVNISRNLPSNLSAEVVIIKYFMGIPIKLPCYKDIGTCHYKDVCGLLGDLWPATSPKRSIPGADPVQCPRQLKKHRIPCRCPFTQGLYHLPRLQFQLPEISGALESIAEGEYDVRVRLHDDSNRKELGCLRVSFYMKGRHSRRMVSN